MKEQYEIRGETFKTLAIVALVFFAWPSRATTILDSNGAGGFELGGTFAANGWTEVNGTETNKWFCGSVPAGTTGTACGYISNDVAGAIHNYTNVGSTTHLWRDIIIPAGEDYVTISFSVECNGETNDMLKVFVAPTSVTPAAGTVINSSYQVGTTISGYTAWQTITFSANCIGGTTKRLIFQWKNNGNSTVNQPPAAIDNISVTSSASAPSCSSLMGTGYVSVPSLPYTSTGRTTCGKVNDLTDLNSNTCGSSIYYYCEDEVFAFTPSSSGSINIVVSNASSSYSAIMLYNTCPSSSLCGGTGCIAYDQNYSTSHSICQSVTAGTTYYLLVDGYNSPSCFTYDISISAPSTTLQGSTCSNPVVISSLPFTATGQTTSCYGNDYSNSTLGSCGTLYESGEDIVYSYTAAGPECIAVSLSNMSSSCYTGFQIYNACPGSGTGICVANYGGACANFTKTVTLPSAGTYYFIVDSWAPPSSVTFDISITSFGSGPSNDLPCNATPLTIGAVMSGDNSCSGSTSEPSAPSCWYAGTLNTVWYSFTAPASGQVHIAFSNGSLIYGQIALYSGSCGSLSLVSGSCKDYTTMLCSGATVSSLTAGTTYYLRVDGYGDYIGSFNILVDDNSLTLHGITGGDCEGALDVCGTSYSNSTPSLGCGGVVDVPNSPSVSNPSTNPASSNSGCLLSSPPENNIRWYKLYINTSGLLAWTLSGPGSGFFDWEMWNVTSSSCAAIKSNSLAPVRCNWNASSLGMTGMQSTVPPGGVAGNFEQPLSVTAGDTYMLAISNYSTNLTPYTLDFSNSTCGIGNSTSSTWTGTAGTSWTTTSNWSGCGIPSCSVDAVVSITTNQPVISGNVTVRNLTINGGATLTLSSGASLTVCGDFTNNGTFTAASNSTVIFSGTGTQNIYGTVTGTNKFGNLTITKSSGTVVLNQNIDVSGNFTTTNGTSIFNSNGMYFKVAGNFSNANGSSTFTNATAGTMEFNGSTTQTYSPGASLTLNNALMNQSTASSLTLSANMTVSGTLTLTSGRITTGSYEVSVTNAGVTSVAGGNLTSYVDGNLRRSVNSTGSYDFPVGHFASGKGYQLARINFTSATNVTSLLAKFQPYSVVPPALGLLDCGKNYNLPSLDNGYWTITATPAMTSGVYTATLFNTTGTYTNSGGATSWSVTKNDGSGWGLNGTCATSTINQVVRTSMFGFSDFGTAQSSVILPIELTSFTATGYAYGNLLHWETASEWNNDYFTPERSVDGKTFTPIGNVDAAGNEEGKTYEFVDRNPVPGVNYYRLMQVDLDGQSQFSNVITLENFAASMTLSEIKPNPTNDEFYITLDAPLTELIDISLVDMYGNRISSWPMIATQGENRFHISTDQLQAGIYILEITGHITGSSLRRNVMKY